MKFKGNRLIDNLGTITTGKTPSTKNSEYWNGNIPFITPKDLQVSKHIISTERNITQLGAATVKGSIIPINSVCVSCIGVIGYVGITTAESVSNQQINSIIVNENNDTDYVYYLMKWLWPYFKNYEGQSTTLSILNKTHFSKIEIPLHPLDYQRKVSKLLSMIDDKIELNQQINKNLEEQAQAIYTSTFVTNSDSLWEVGSLSDFITVKYGKDHKKLADGKYPVYGSGGIMRYVERPLYDKESVLIPRKGTLNNVMYVNEPFWSVDTMFFTEMKRPNVAKFVFHFVKSINLETLNAGSAVPSMTTAILAALPLRLPDNGTLEMFEKSVSPIYEMIQYKNAENKKLAAIRDALLPRLMSGEVDVSGIEF